MSKIRIILDRLCSYRELVKNAYAELAELERLAEIGRAITMLIQEETVMYDVRYNMYSFNSEVLKSVDDLLEWYNKQ